MKYFNLKFKTKEIYKHKRKLPKMVAFSISIKDILDK